MVRKNCCESLPGNFLQRLLIDIEVGVDVLHIFVIFERFHQPDHLCCLLPFQLDVGIGNHAHARGCGRDASLLHGF